MDRTNELVAKVLDLMDELKWSGEHSVQVHPELDILFKGMDDVLDDVLQQKREAWEPRSCPDIQEVGGHVIMVYAGIAWTRFSGGTWKKGNHIPKEDA